MYIGKSTVSSIEVTYPYLTEYTNSNSCSGNKISYYLPSTCSNYIQGRTWNPSILSKNKNNKDGSNKILHNSIKPYKSYVYSSDSTHGKCSL